MPLSIAGRNAIRVAGPGGVGEKVAGTVQGGVRGIVGVALGRGGLVTVGGSVMVALALGVTVALGIGVAVAVGTGP